MSSKEFGGNELIPSQQGVAGPVFSDAARNLYLMRTIDTDPERDASSLAEVRDLVMADSESRARFEALETRIPELEADAIQNGMQSVADQFGHRVSFRPRSPRRTPVPPIRHQVSDPVPWDFRDAQTVVDAVFSKASSLDFMTLTTDIPAQDRTFFVADGRTSRWS